MADLGEEEEEYESDPEQAKLSLKMRRRREASDDEEDDNDDDDDEDVVVGGDLRVRERIVDSRVSDCESDGQGAAAEYEDEYDLVDEEEEAEFVGVRTAAAVVVEDSDGVSGGGKRENDRNDGEEFYGGDQFDENGNGRVEDGEGGTEEKKEAEPFAVPTAGAFYMHDDRFRDSSGGRHRRTLGGRKLWELRDDRKWGHDKFEEMSMQERHYDTEGRRGSRGRNRARGRNRGEDQGFVRGNRPKAYNNNNNNNNNNNQSNVGPKSVRGRGPRRYQPSTQNNFEAPAQNRPPTKSMDKTSGRSSSVSESSQYPLKKTVAASSNLNSASPPFYPSASSNKETKKEPQSGGPLRVPQNYPVSQPNNPRGRNANPTDSLPIEKLYIDDSVSGKPVNNNLQSRTYQAVPHQHHHPHQHNNQVVNNRVSSPNQVHSSFQRGGGSVGGSRGSSPPPPRSSSSGGGGGPHVESTVEMESCVESNDSKMALVGKGKGSIIQSSGMTSFSYAGAQLMGPASGNHGDSNFPGAPTFLPVMQFAGQHHPGGLGVPAVGMAFPGYVAQPNGMGNSEMTWLPVLAGAAGAPYCSPYITMDGAYHARPSASLPPATSKESNNNGTNKPGSEVKPSQRPEVANDELRQRQNKGQGRRYTEMKFDK